MHANVYRELSIFTDAKIQSKLTNTENSIPALIIRYETHAYNAQCFLSISKSIPQLFLFTYVNVYRVLFIFIDVNSAFQQKIDFKFLLKFK